MKQFWKLTATVTGMTLVVGAIAGCSAAHGSGHAAAGAAPHAPSTSAPTATPLPNWAQGTTWIVYPKGLKCAGTEGCPNDYRAIFGEPGSVLPKGVRLYDPATDWLPSMSKAYAPKK